MTIRIFFAAALILLLPLSARAAWDPHSTAAAPCGIGIPPLGHILPDFASPDRVKHLSLTVKQDGDRLCYVADGIADAPVIRLHAGDELVVTLRNEITDPAAIAAYLPPAPSIDPRTPVPDRVGFYPVEPGMQHVPTGATNLHMHGFPVSPRAPEDEVVKTCVDPATGPPRCGRRQVTYVYHVPATMPAGLYWYHSHIHGEVQAQTQMGLLGAIVVEGPADEVRRKAGIGERVLVIGQQRKPPKPDQAAPMAAPSDKHGMSHRAPHRSIDAVDTEHEVSCGAVDTDGPLTLNGTPIVAPTIEEMRLAQKDGIAGTHLDADGDLDVDRLRKPIPGADAHLAEFAIPAGGKQLWRVVNGASDDYLNLAVVDEEGAPVAIGVVARDGAPLSDDAGHLLPPEPVSDRQLVPPAGRLEFLIDAPPTGHKRYLITDAVDTGCTGDPEAARQLAVVVPGPPQTTAASVDPATTQPAAAIDAAADPFTGLLARKTDRVRTIALTEYPRPGRVDENDFYITELQPGAVMRPYDMRGRASIITHAGAVEEWVIENWTHEIHAFHIHQVHFRVLEENGRAFKNPPLLDVVNVPFANPDAQMPPGYTPIPGRVRIKVYFPPEFVGDIPFHCHLMQHEDNGMMGIIRVLPAPSRAEAPGATAVADALDRLTNPPICHGASPATLKQRFVDLMREPLRVLGLL
jgi:FtsP/CotA-like multicopper oxidase with cupredoxin domain